MKKDEALKKLKETKGVAEEQVKAILELEGEVSNLKGQNAALTSENARYKEIVQQLSLQIDKKNAQIIGTKKALEGLSMLVG